MNAGERELYWGLLRYAIVWGLVIGGLIWFSVWHRNRSFASRWDDPALSEVQKRIADPKSFDK